MTSSLVSWLDDASLVVLVGDGGVGKTTCSAALALAVAATGRSVCVLTIDPAPRLADALGMPQLDDTPRPVDLGRWGLEHPRAALSAMRLDTHATFDRLVMRYAPTEQAARTVLDSPLYQVIAGRLGGSDVYMAFQRVYELIDADRYEVLVIDTPPAVHADELFSAPTRLTSMLESGATKIIANPASLAARSGSRVAATAARMVLGALSRVTGLDLLARISEFTGSMEAVLERLSGRAAEVEQKLHGSGARVVHVTTAGDHCADDARRLIRALAVYDIEPAAWIVNRMLGAAGPKPGERCFDGAPAGLREIVESIEADMDRLRAGERAAVEALRAVIGTRAQMLTIDAVGTAAGGSADLGLLARSFERGEA